MDYEYMFNESPDTEDTVGDNVYVLNDNGEILVIVLS